MANRQVFVTIKFEGSPVLFDYPKELPIPRLKETVIFNAFSGIVSDVKHMTSGNVSEIQIITV